MVKPYPGPFYGVDYDVWRARLIEATGSWCAYCESPVTNDASVEHKAAKTHNGGFPDNQTDWVNLVIACQACNSAKGAHPNQADADALASAGDDLYRVVMTKWAWPDDVTGMPLREYCPPAQQAYQLFTCEYSAQAPSALAARGLHVLERLDVAVTQPATMLWVVPNTTYIATLPAPSQPAAQSMAQRTIQTLGLNRLVPDDPKASDRRVANRTAAYQTALGALSDLTAAVQASNDDNTRVLMKAIALNALTTGFWSVWMYVFQQPLLQPTAAQPVWSALQQKEPTLGPRILTALFLTYPPGWSGPNSPSRTIHRGTDLTRLGFTPSTFGGQPAAAGQR